MGWGHPHQQLSTTPHSGGRKLSTLRLYISTQPLKLSTHQYARSCAPWRARERRARPCTPAPTSARIPYRRSPRAPAAAASSCLCARAGRQRPADSMGGRRWPPPTAPSSSAARRQSCRDGVAYHSLNLDPAHALPLVGERKQVTRGALYKRGHALPVNGIAVDHRRTHHVRALKAGRRPERGHAGNCLRKGGECHAVE
jgi:hypothetical protein